MGRRVLSFLIGTAIVLASFTYLWHLLWLEDYAWRRPGRYAMVLLCGLVVLVAAVLSSRRGVPGVERSWPSAIFAATGWILLFVWERPQLVPIPFTPLAHSWLLAVPAWMLFSISIGLLGWRRSAAHALSFFSAPAAFVVIAVA